MAIRNLIDLSLTQGATIMAKVCEVCGRGPQFGNRISHAHNVTKRRWNLNLQSVRAVVNGAAKRIRVCTSCIRSGKVQKAGTSSKARGRVRPPLAQTTSDEFVTFQGASATPKRGCCSAIGWSALAGSGLLRYAGGAWQRRAKAARRSKTLFRSPPADSTFPLDSVKLLAPVPRPPKLICIGLNYRDHAAEAGRRFRRCRPSSRSFQTS